MAPEHGIERCVKIHSSVRPHTCHLFTGCAIALNAGPVGSLILGVFADLVSTADAN